MEKALRRSLVLVLVLLAAGAFLAPRFLRLGPAGVAARPAATEAAESTDNTGASGTSTEPPLRVEVLTLTPETLVERLETVGTLRAAEQVEIVSEVAGKVVAVLFDEGRPVEAGQPLVRIDASELLAQRRRIEHQLHLAELREERQRGLLDEGVISEQDYDAALSGLLVLEAERALVEARLEKTEIRAPFAGTLGLRGVSLGSYLTPQTRIASLQDLDPMKVDFAVPEKYAGRLGPGSTVRFRVSGVESTFAAEVYAVEPAVDPETRSLSLRARSANPDGLLRPGAFADIQVEVRRLEGALAVPALAVVPELGGKTVFVLDGDVAQPRRVETGLRTADRVQIVSGLAAGERVIVTGVQQLAAGRRVEAVAAPPGAPGP